MRWPVRAADESVRRRDGARVVELYNGVVEEGMSCGEIIEQTIVVEDVYRQSRLNCLVEQPFEVSYSRGRRLIVLRPDYDVYLQYLAGNDKV